MKERKKSLIIVLFLSAFLAALLVFVFWPVTARADALKGVAFTGGNPDEATVKPKITVSQKTIDLAEAKANGTATVTISVSDAAGSYCYTGLWVKYDSRLTLSDSQPVTAESAISGLGSGIKKDIIENNSLYLQTDAKSYAGTNGDMWSIEFKLPADATPGDEFPIELWNTNSPIYETMFMNSERDLDGINMQAYAFTKGITHGYIKIKKEKASVKTEPAAKSLTYNASAQELVTKGSTLDGTMMYAIGDSNTEAPTVGWSDKVPKETAAKSYFVWFKVSGDSKHEDSDPKCLSAGIAKKDLKVTAKDQTYVYNGQIQGPGDAAYTDPAEIADVVTAEGLEGKDALTGVVIDGQGTEPGTYPLTLCSVMIGDANDNYNVTCENGTLTIKEDKEEPVVNKKQAKISLDAGLMGTSSKGKVIARWGKAKDADYYEIYATYCGGHSNYKKIKTVNGTICKYDIKKLEGQKLNPKKCVKYYIVAYKTVNGKKVKLAKSLPVHVVGSANTVFTNIKSIKVAKKAYSLKTGKKAKIKAKLVLYKKGRKTLDHERKFRYATSNDKVATVNKKGKIEAVGNGKCNIYVYAQNGCAKKIKVTVK